MKKAVVIVDMLNDFAQDDEFYQGKLFVQGSREIIGYIKGIKDSAESAGVPVIYLCEDHDPDDKEFEKWPEHGVKDTYGAEIIDELKPGEKNQVFAKKDISAFARHEFRQYLEQEGIEELIVTGVATDYCVRAVALAAEDKHGNIVPGAIERGYKVTVVVDAIAGVDEIVLPDGSSVPGTKGNVAKALVDMGKAGVTPKYTAQVLEEMVR